MNETQQVRIVTYNIHKCRGLDRRVRLDRIAKVLREINADIIALQEILSAPEDRSKDQAGYIAADLGLSAYFGENRRLNGVAYGNLVLSRYPLDTVSNYDISVHGREERGCMRVDARVAEALVLHIFNVHLGTAYLERRQQGRKLLSPEILNNRRLPGARIVLGDFNEWTRGLATQLLRAHFRSADIKKHIGSCRTYPGLLPFLHLDHIYFDPTLKLEALALHRSRTALVASDHLPLVADFSVSNIQ